MRCLPVSPHGEFAPTEFLIPRKRQYCAHDATKHVYFSFFNPLKVTDQLEIESLGWVYGGELCWGELIMGRNRYKPLQHIKSVRLPTTWNWNKKAKSFSLIVTKESTLVFIRLTPTPSWLSFSQNVGLSHSDAFVRTHSIKSYLLKQRPKLSWNDDRVVALL